MALAEGAVPGVTVDAPRRAAGLAVTVVCLLLIVKVASAGTVQVSQAPWVVALFVLPLAYAVPGGRRLLDRHRSLVLVVQGVQGVLTRLPFAVSGGARVAGTGGLLAGLMLLTVGGRVSWVLAWLLLAADVVVRAAVAGPPVRPAGRPGRGAVP